MLDRDHRIRNQHLQFQSDLMPPSACPPPHPLYNSNMHRAPSPLSRFTAACLAAVLFITTGCHTQPTLPANAPPASMELIKRSIEYLSSDDLEGRGPRTAGLDSAAR